MIADWLAGAFGCSTDMQCEHAAMMLDWGLDLIEVCWTAGVIFACWCYLRHLASRFKDHIGFRPNKNA